MRRIEVRVEHARALMALARGRIRARLLALRGARVGEKVAIGNGCAFERPWCLAIGSRVTLEADVYLKVVADSASLEIDDHVFLGRGVEFDVMDGITVGRHTVIAPRCFISDHSHGTAASLRIDQQACRCARTRIGADVWLGAGVVVLAGVTIGDGAVVGANSVVTHDVAPMAVVAGCPARFIRLRTSARFDAESRAAACSDVE